MKAFAIRQVGTNLWLQNYRSSGTGITHQEPEPVVHLPGLYPTRNHAQQAISWWRQGSWRNDHSYDGEWDGVKVHPKPLRAQVQLEIVEFDLVEVLA